MDVKELELLIGRASAAVKIGIECLPARNPCILIRTANTR
jgi:hypothetical protein